MHNRQSTYLRYNAYAIAWALFILFATVANTSTLERLNLKSLFAYDKPIHAVLFGIQAYLLIRSGFLRTLDPKSRVGILVFMSGIYGVLTEGLQFGLTTSRTFDVFDMLADVLGCLITFGIMRKRAE